MYLKFLTIRNGYYYFRRKVWTDVQQIINKKEIWLSLKTTDMKTAEVRVRRYATITDAFFSAIREKKTLMDIDKALKDALGYETTTKETLPDGTIREQTKNLTPDDIRVALESVPESMRLEALGMLLNGQSLPAGMQTTQIIPVQPEKTEFSGANNLNSTAPLLTDGIAHYRTWYQNKHKKPISRKQELHFRRLQECSPDSVKLNWFNQDRADEIVEMLKKIPIDTHKTKNKTVPEIIKAYGHLNIGRCQHSCRINHSFTLLSKHPF